MSENRKQITKMIADFSTIGMTVAFSIFIGVGFGYYLDHKLFAGRTKPWFTLIFLGFGVAAAFLNLYRMATRQDIKDG
jgi:F0F1-type ATP synthase assembly protein I